jgi:hypothetical protein
MALSLIGRLTCNQIATTEYFKCKKLTCTRYKSSTLKNKINLSATIIHVSVGGEVEEVVIVREGFPGEMTVLRDAKGVSQMQQEDGSRH